MSALIYETPHQWGLFIFKSLSYKLIFKVGVLILIDFSRQAFCFSFSDFGFLLQCG